MPPPALERCCFPWDSAKLQWVESNVILLWHCQEENKAFCSQQGTSLSLRGRKHMYHMRTVSVQIQPVMRSLRFPGRLMLFDSAGCQETSPNLSLPGSEAKETELTC
jgi:hypothetical protein